MSKLYRRCFQATDFSELEEEIENTRQEVRDCPDRLQRRRLMYLADTQNLREEASLASGADAKSLSDILGHTQASFARNTDTRITDEMLRKAVLHIWTAPRCGGTAARFGRRFRVEGEKKIPGRSCKLKHDLSGSFSMDLA